MTKMTDKQAFQMIHESNATVMPGYDDHLIVWCHPAVSGVRELPGKAKNHDGCWVCVSHDPHFPKLLPYVYLKATGWLPYPKHAAYEKKQAKKHRTPMLGDELPAREYKQLMKLVDKMCAVDVKVRNLAAHELIEFAKRWASTVTGKKLLVLLRRFKKKGKKS
jgi:hypothetical protein